jgi:transposase
LSLLPLTVSRSARIIALLAVLDEGKSVGAAPRDLDLTESSLRNWLERARADRSRGKLGVLTTGEREELGRLRKEVRELRMERAVFRKAAAFFAKNHQ